jgi:septum formation protein
MTSLILASTSTTRQQMLRDAGIEFESCAPAVDEAALKSQLVKQGADGRVLAETLAEAKAKAVSVQNPSALVIGADQILAIEDNILLDKAESPQLARAQLKILSGKGHRLISAVVVAAAGVPVWRHVGIAQLLVRPLSDAFIDDYVAKHWADIRHSVGCYQIEGPGAQLFSRVEGDYFDILGLPLLPLLNFLRERNIIAS